MALELFRPFVIAKLVERELAHNIRGAGRLIEEGIPEVWAILEEVIQGKHVLLNRAPTLHRQGIQAFRPILIEGNAIQLHPLVCPAFNADFDGDQMAVHVPLSDEAQLEAATIMSAAKNVLKPGSSQPVIFEKPLDIALGVYWMTRDIKGEKGEGLAFPSPNAAILAYDFDIVDIHAKIWVLPTEGRPKYAPYKGERFETTVGRLLFNSILPSDYLYVNHEVKKKELGKLVDDVIRIYGLAETPRILDKLKNFGFKFATKSGITFSFSDLVVPKEKKTLIEAARKEAQNIKEQYEQGLLTADERLRLIVELWQKAIGDIEKSILPALDTNSSVYTMIVSGARGSARQLSQMAGMKGLVTNTKGEVIEFPVVSSMKEGLTPIEYFTTTHGSRKGLTDTALKTAHAGYLTRRLFDVAQDLVVAEEDCGTKHGVAIHRVRSSGMEADLSRLIVGRVLAKDVEEGSKSWKRSTLLSIDDAKAIADSGIAEVTVRSPMSCTAERGICQKCYGSDLATREMIDIGEAVGTIAAQAIGEPGTQLTMRTFHTGGVATIGGDITHGLPRVEELFDKRPPKAAAILSAVEGMVTEIVDDMGVKTIHILPDGGSSKKEKITYEVPHRRVSLVKVGNKVAKGQPVTDGSVNLDELFELAGRETLQQYIIDEVSKIYDLQGAPVSHKHMEVIIRQMFSRVRVLDPGESSMVMGEIIEAGPAHLVNRALEKEGKTPAKLDNLVLGITEVSLNRKSFLAAASFQHTTRTLIQASLRGTIDRLEGLKENVIIGRIIPAGTGFKGSKKYERIRAFQEERTKKLDALMAEEEAREKIVDLHA
jgi:DNA-directed RNA polymerase subunit beta'